MDYEKKYKEALERARDYWETDNDNTLNILAKGTMEYLFPELCESEDAKIWKALIGFLKEEEAKADITSKHSETLCKYIAWLEKQGEKTNPYSGVSFEYNGHIWGMCARDDGVEIIFDGELKAFLSSEKSFIYPIRPQPDLMSKSALEAAKEEKVNNADKVEPKFKVGDCVVGKYISGYITEVRDDCYLLDYQGFSIDKQDDYHLWTIEDAKDGDVLTDGNLPFIFKKIDTNKYCYAYCGISADDGFRIKSEGKLGEWTWMQDIKPATKEQRDLLFQKMREAGYEWDDEKKELKKIELTDEYEGLTDFERTLADICIGWIGEELGWKQYIKDNADVLLKIAIEKFNSVQDVPFE